MRVLFLFLNLAFGIAALLEITTYDFVNFSINDRLRVVVSNKILFH